MCSLSWILISLALRCFSAFRQGNNYIRFPFRNHGTCWLPPEATCALGPGVVAPNRPGGSRRTGRKDLLICNPSQDVPCHWRDQGTGPGRECVHLFQVTSGNTVVPALAACTWPKARAQVSKQRCRERFKACLCPSTVFLWADSRSPRPPPGAAVSISRSQVLGLHAR